MVIDWYLRVAAESCGWPWVATSYRGTANGHLGAEPPQRGRARKLLEPNPSANELFRTIVVLDLLR
eukprot:6893668-Alexandrium_andersonii.AAC.1